MPKRKSSKTKKTKTYAKIKTEAWNWFSKYIRLRDALVTTGTKEYAACFSCGIIKPWKEMDAGHFRHNHFDFDERNVHAQCSRCNRFLHGNLSEYTIHMIDHYGRKVVDELMGEDNETYTKDMLVALKKEYKELYQDALANN